MRSLLTLFAVLLVALMTAALIVPQYVDWSAYRAEIAARLEGLAGGEVTLTGPVSLRLLPTPYLEVGPGSAAGAGPDAPALAFEGARFELALAKLASGSFRFSDVELKDPVLTLTRRADGGLVAPKAAPAPAGALGADRLSVRNGTIRIVAKGGGPAFAIAGVTLEGDVASLAGPYRLSGRALGPGGAPIVFRLVSEPAGPAGAPVRLAIEAGPVWPALEFDGTLSGLGANGPHAVGSAIVTGAAAGVEGPLPWRAAGKVAADLDGATLTEGDFRIGPDERAIRATGAASLALRAPGRLVVAATVRQANLAALLRGKGEAVVPPARAVDALTAALGPALAGAGTMRFDARITADVVLLGGAALSGLAAAIETTPDASTKARIAVGLPGKSRLAADGEVETGAAARFVGAVDFASADPGALLGWAGRGAPALADWAAALGDAVPASDLAVSGRIEAAAVGVSGRDLKIALGRSRLTGALAVTRPVGADPGRIYVDLATESLDVAVLPRLAAAQTLVGGYDLALSFEAKALNLAHVGDAGIVGASLALKLDKAGPRLTLSRLALAGLGGAALEATGAAGPDGVTASGRLEAQRLADFARLVERLAPGPWSEALVQRAARLSPASVAFEAAGGPPSPGAPPLLTLKATGTLGGTRAALSLAPAAKGDGQAFKLTLESADSSALLDQLGVGGTQPGSAGRLEAGRLELAASGGLENGFDVDATAALAGASLSGRGRYAPQAEGDDARLFGSVKLSGINAAPLASRLGLAPEGRAIGPVEASADLTLRGRRWSFSRIAASVAGARASGALTYEPPAEASAPLLAPELRRAEEAVNGAVAEAPRAQPALTGELSFDRLRLADLFALALGPPQAAASGKVWSAANFAAPPLTPPAAALRLNVGALTVVDGLVGQGFSTRLHLDAGRLDLDDLAMKLNDRAVSGRATLRRGGDTATLDGAVAVEPVAVARPGFAGRVGGRLDFASTGRSPAELIVGLAGGGAVNIAGGALPLSDPGALERVVAAAQAPEARIDEASLAMSFAAALDKGPLAIPDGPAPIALIAGTIRLGPIALARPSGGARLEASFDLTRLALATRLGLSAPAAGLKFWSGPDPNAAVIVDDALDAPKRRLDVASLAAGLASQAIARESDRISTIEADIRERAFFNRRLKGQQFLDRREAEIQDWRAEQARLNGLAQHLADEKAEAERAAAEAPNAPTERQPDAPEAGPSLAGPQTTDAPTPPRRPKPRPIPQPTAGGLY